MRGDDRLPRAHAEADLVRCAQVAELRQEAPVWLLVNDEEFAESQYLMLGDDIAIVVVPLGRGQRWAATTVVTRTDTGSVEMARRRSARHLRMLQQRESSPRRMRGGSARRHSGLLTELDD